MLPPSLSLPRPSPPAFSNPFTSWLVIPGGGREEEDDIPFHFVPRGRKRDWRSPTTSGSAGYCCTLRNFINVAYATHKPPWINKRSQSSVTTRKKMTRRKKVERVRVFRGPKEEEKEEEEGGEEDSSILLYS